MSDEKTPVLVTTEHRGVFSGLYDGDPADADKAKLTLTEARMCVRWSDQMRGLPGLAKMGPDGECRISPAVDELTIFDVTAVALLTDQAWERWREEPWED